VFKNYLKIAFRNILKHKGYSFINITGLALGLACSIFIFMWVQDELNFDRYNEKGDSIYRLEEDQSYSGRIYHVTVTPYPVGPEYKERIPEVINAARFNWYSTLLKYGDKSFYESKIVGIDSTFLEMFTLEFVRGDINKALTDPYSIIMNDEVAEKYFGDENPIGKTISFNNEYDFKVTGVFKKMPHNVSYQFEVAFPFEFFKELGRWSDHWGANSITTFVQLAPGSNIPALNEKLTEILVEHNPETLTKYMVFPLFDMHLYGHFGYGNPMGDIQYVYIFSVIALFVLLIACINFMNLSTARSANRSKEIGLRKVVGALRKSLIQQFYGESLIMAFIGLIFAVGIVALLLGQFNEFTRKEITIDIFTSWQFIAGLFGITLIAGLIAGSYPALYLSSFTPVKVLRGSLKSGAKGSMFRRVLVVIQFSLSVFLIIGTVIIYNQLIFMKEKDLGYDKEHLVYFIMRGNLPDSYHSIKNEFKRTEGVIGVSASNHPPNMIGSNSGGADWDDKDPESQILIGTNVVDYDFCKTMKIELASGRSFSEEFPGELAAEEDTLGNFLVNEETVKVMNKTNETVLGARFAFMGIDGKVVGVMKNFHYNTVRTKIEPLAMALAPDYIRFMVVRMAPGNIQQTLDNLKNSWNAIVPNYPFEYRFLDEDFERWYRRDERMVSLLQYFSVLAIIIACLGLFGLASFTAEQRTKEIGIRKTLGASEINLTYLLCKEFLILVGISNLIAWPIAYYALNGWLEEFAYKTDIGFLFFLFAGALSLIIALGTVSFQAIKAALTNPIKSLRYE